MALRSINDFQGFLKEVASIAEPATPKEATFSWGDAEDLTDVMQIQVYSTEALVWQRLWRRDQCHPLSTRWEMMARIPVPESKAHRFPQPKPGRKTEKPEQLYRSREGSHEMFPSNETMG